MKTKDFTVIKEHVLRKHGKSPFDQYEQDMMWYMVMDQNVATKLKRIPWFYSLCIESMSTSFVTLELETYRLQAHYFRLYFVLR